MAAEPSISDAIREDSPQPTNMLALHRGGATRASLGEGGTTAPPVMGADMLNRQMELLSRAGTLVVFHAVRSGETETKVYAGTLLRKADLTADEVTMVPPRERPSMALNDWCIKLSERTRHIALAQHVDAPAIVMIPVNEHWAFTRLVHATVHQAEMRERLRAETDTSRGLRDAYMARAASAEAELAAVRSAMLETNTMLQQAHARVTALTAEVMGLHARIQTGQAELQQAQTNAMAAQALATQTATQLAQVAAQQAVQQAQQTPQAGQAPPATPFPQYAGPARATAHTSAPSDIVYDAYTPSTWPSREPESAYAWMCTLEGVNNTCPMKVRRAQRLLNMWAKVAGEIGPGWWNHQTFVVMGDYCAGQMRLLHNLSRGMPFTDELKAFYHLDFSEGNEQSYLFAKANDEKAEAERKKREAAKARENSTNVSRQQQNGFKRAGGKQHGAGRGNPPPPYQPTQQQSSGNVSGGWQTRQ